MERGKKIKLIYVFHTLETQDLEVNQTALDAKNLVLDYIIKKIIFENE